MRRLRIRFIHLFLLVPLLVPLIIPIIVLQPIAARSDTRVVDGQRAIVIADTRHRDIDDNFFDRSLEEKLAINGSLGLLLDEAARLPKDQRILFIDPMLIEEVEDLADGFLLLTADGTEEIEVSEVANSWLARLRTLIDGDEIAAINYGNPETSFFLRSAPSELRIHHKLSRQRLAEILSREVGALALPVATSKRLPNFLTERFTEHRREIRSINRYAKNTETRKYRLINASLLDPNFPRERSFQFAKDLGLSIDRYRNSIRITSGRYTLTSRNERIPVTLINDFSNDLTVKVRILASNSRVIVGSIDPIEIAPQSKLQVAIPVEVLSSGQSDLIITMTTLKGQRIGEEVRLPLTLAVISPLTTWITTGSGLILLLAAIVQSVRRVRRSRKRSSAEEES